MSRALFSALLLACAIAVPAHSKPVRVLFVGNEAVERVGIPARLGELAKAMGKDAHIESLATTGRTLADQWADARVRAAIAQGWDYVVLQQRPAVAPEEAARLAADAQRFAVPIRAAGAKPALLMTWPRNDRRAEFPAAIASARAAAKAAGAIPIPVAEAWLRILSADGRASLYAGSSSASALGADLAVLTIWFALFPAGPQEFDDAYLARLGRALDMDSARIAGFVDAATRAIDEPLRLP